MPSLVPKFDPFTQFSYQPQFSSLSQRCRYRSAPCLHRVLSMCLRLSAALNIADWITINIGWLPPCDRQRFSPNYRIRYIYVFWYSWCSIVMYVYLRTGTPSRLKPCIIISFYTVYDAGCAERNGIRCAGSAALINLFPVAPTICTALNDITF